MRRIKHESEVRKEMRNDLDSGHIDEKIDRKFILEIMQEFVIPQNLTLF